MTSHSTILDVIVMINHHSEYSYVMILQYYLSVYNVNFFSFPNYKVHPLSSRPSKSESSISRTEIATIAKN
jgi:hypothetical protein